MLKLLQGKIACVPIFDSADTGIGGVKGHVDALGAQLGYKQHSGNIQLLDQYRERVDQGVVKYMGHGVTKERFGFGIGDLVIFSGYTGELVSIEGEGLFILLPARFVVATVIPEPTQVPGVFFQDAATLEYFPATYEKVIDLATKAIEEANWRDINVKHKAPDLEEYDTHIEELTDDDE